MNEETKPLSEPVPIKLGPRHKLALTIHALRVEAAQARQQGYLEAVLNEHNCEGAWTYDAETNTLTPGQ